MGRRANRRKPTRAEKARRGEHQTSNAQHRTSNKKIKPEDPPERRREISPETRDIVLEYAQVMGWEPERVLPNHDRVSA